MSDFEKAFAALRASTEDAMAAVDVSAAVMLRTRRRRAIRWLPLAAAALIAMLVWRDLALARSVTIVAEDGWLVTPTGQTTLPRESTLRGDFTVRSNEHPIIMRSSNWTATLAGHGEAAFAWLSEDNVKKRSAALTGAVAVIVVYAGVLSFSEPGVALRAPAAAVLDRDGKAYPIAASEAENLTGGAEGGITVRDRGHGPFDQPGNAAGEIPSGGYWDASRGAVRFRLAGEVFDASSGRPIDIFEVQVAPADRASSGPRNHRVTGATDGHFLVDGISLGAWHITVRAAGYAPSRQLLTLAAVADDPYLVVPLTSGAKLTGTVVDTRGEPVEGAEIGLGNCKASCGTTTSDGKGNFVLKSAPEDTPFTLAASHPRYGNAMLPNLRVAEGATEHVHVVLSGILKVTGHVYRGPEHAPVAGALVKGGEASTLTDDSGAYELFVPLEGHPVVRVVTGTPPVEMESYPEERGAEPVRWATAKTHTAELNKDFFLAMETGRLVGRISEADGAPVVGARLLIANTMGWSKRDHQTFPAETTTDAGGRYRIDDLPAHAAYRIRLARGDDEQPLGTVALDTPREVEANFVLATNEIHGRFIDVHDREAFPMVQGMCDGIGATRVGEDAFYPLKCQGDGTFEVEHIPAGRYRIAGIGNRLRSLKLAETYVDVPARAPVEVHVEGERLLTWTARVTDAAGNFVREPVMRYEVQHGENHRTLITSSVSVSDEGTTTFSTPASLPEVVIEASGYAPARVQLVGRDPKALLDVRLAREPTP